MSFRHCAEIAAEKGLHLREVIAVNGGARSAVWRQILCDALGVPLLYVPDGAGAPTGGALLAGMAVGLVDGVATARRWRSALVRHAPDAARTEIYAGLLAGRRELYPAIRQIA